MQTIIQIALETMRFYAYHGVMPQERKVGNNYEVSLVVTVDVAQAVASDDLQYTVNYAQLYDVVKTEMAIPSQLLEHVGGRIVQRIMTDFDKVTALEMKVTKLSPPFGGNVRGASVTFTVKK